MRVFVTGASGWVGSAVVPELIAAGHQVVGLARSPASAAALMGVGAAACLGTLDDLEVLRAAAAGADGVIHLAYRHDIAFSGDPDLAARSDLRAIQAMGAELEKSGRPFVIATGLAGLPAGQVATEQDVATPNGPGGQRAAAAEVTLAFAAHGVRSAVVRLPPTVHGAGDNGFIPMTVAIAREKGLSGYIGDGSNRWPAVHRLDAAQLFRLALEDAPAGSVLHGIAEQAVPIRDVAEVIGRHLNLPVVSLAGQDAADHFGWLTGLLGGDFPASSVLTRNLMGWQPTQPGLIQDLDLGHYFP